MKQKAWVVSFLILGGILFLFTCAKVVRQTSEFRFTERIPFVKETNFVAHKSYVFYGVFSSDGTYLATGSADRTVRLWQTKNWQQVGEIQETYSQIWGMPLAFSSDDRYVVYGAYDTLVLWDMREKRILAKKKGHHGGIQTIKKAEDMVVSGGSDGFVRLWRLPDLSLVKERKISSREIWSVAYDPQKRVIVAGGEDGSISVFTFPELVPIYTTKEHLLPVEYVSVAPGGKIFASGGGEGVIFLWDEMSATPLKALRGHVGAVLVVTFLDDTYLVSGGEDDMILFWDWRQEKIVGMENVGSDVMALQYDPVSKKIFVGTRQGDVHIWRFQ
ncbi:MAG: WD40 repeat domain-containing protein [Brevinematales bacterium]|nr:WD40 repeat domain-containing protein [Brevinematales bacterium]